MTRKKLHLLHTSEILQPVFEELCGAELPHVDVVHQVDGSLIKDVIEAGELTADVAQRVVQHVRAAGDHADLIMVTCSSIGAAVEAAAEEVATPVLRVDQPMADRAIEIGSRIGVAATLPTTLVPTADLIRRRAALAKRPIELVERLCAGAFEALMSGDTEAHDQIVAAALDEQADEVDVILLAQASMARVAERFAAARSEPPVLSSPSIAVHYLATLL